MLYEEYSTLRMKVKELENILRNQRLKIEHYKRIDAALDEISLKHDVIRDEITRKNQLLTRKLNLHIRKTA